MPTRTRRTPSRSFRAGDLLCDRFRVVRFIARGGMGELYEAEDLTLSERVALKTIRSEIAVHERANQRFLREVQLARKVTHPNICRIFDLFEHVRRTALPGRHVGVVRDDGAAAGRDAVATAPPRADRSASRPRGPSSNRWPLRCRPRTRQASSTRLQEQQRDAARRRAERSPSRRGHRLRACASGR